MRTMKQSRMTKHRGIILEEVRNLEFQGVCPRCKRGREASNA